MSRDEKNIIPEYSSSLRLSNDFAMTSVCRINQIHIRQLMQFILNEYEQFSRAG